MPAMIALVVLIGGWIPSLIDRWRGYRAGNAMRIVALGSCAILVYANLRQTWFWYSTKGFELAAGTSDSFLADTRGQAVQMIADDLRRRSTANETVVVVPEGLMINYLARRS